MHTFRNVVLCHFHNSVHIAVAQPAMPSGYVGRPCGGEHSSGRQRM